MCLIRGLGAWVHFTKREIFGGARAERGFLVSLAAILLMTFLGPFGSYEAMSLPERFIFWTAAISSVAIPMHLAINLALKADRLDPLPRLARIGLGAAVAAVPGTGLVFFVAAVLWPEARGAAEFPETWLQVTVIGFAIGCVHYARTDDDPVTHPEDTATPRPEARPVTRFHKRLDPALGSDIVSLTVQDHYVEVTTTNGNTLLLIRFSDALDELEGLDGLRIHRSHWVAMSHVEGLSREDGKLRVRLSDGRSLPVSQTYARDLRQRVNAR